MGQSYFGEMAGEFSFRDKNGVFCYNLTPCPQEVPPLIEVGENVTEYVGDMIRTEQKESIDQEPTE